MDAPGRVALMARRVLGGTALALWIWVAATHGVAIVGGASMAPVLAPGDVVVYRRGAQGVAVGDLVVFTHPEWSGGVVHRVVGVADDGALSTRGDANRTVDREPVTRDRVRGIAVAVVPSGKLVAVARGADQ